MRKIKTNRITSTTTEQTFDANTFIKDIIIKNIGDFDVQIDFDRDISDDSYLLQGGEALTLEGVIFRRVKYKSLAGSNTLHIIRFLE